MEVDETRCHWQAGILVIPDVEEPMLLVRELPFSCGRLSRPRPTTCALYGCACSEWVP